MRNIFVFAGHGGADPGASYKQHVERDLAIEFRDLVIRELAKLSIQAKTDSNSNALVQTLDWLKGKFGSKDILVDIHWNAGIPSANGSEIFVPDGASSFEMHLGRSLLRVFGQVGFRQRGVKPEAVSPRRRLGFMRPKAENILIEVCFITNDSDMQIYQANKQNLAKLVAKELSDFSKR
jgi:N-acetylmuramoyl-L-alanine amidase